MDSGYPQKIKRKKCSNVLVTSSDDKGKGGGAGGGEPRKHLFKLFWETGMHKSVLGYEYQRYH